MKSMGQLLTEARGEYSLYAEIEMVNRVFGIDPVMDTIKQSITTNNQKEVGDG